MAVRIRLTRLGRKKKPFYRIVAVDSRKRRDGEYLDKIGHFNPLSRPPEIVIDEEKAIDWMKKGATPSDTVKSLFSKKNIMMKFDLLKKGASEEKIAEEILKRDLLLKAKAEEKPKVAKKTEAKAPVEEPKEEKAAEPKEVKAEAPAEEPEKEDAVEAPKAEELKEEKAEAPAKEPEKEEAAEAPKAEEVPAGDAKEEEKEEEKTETEEAKE